MTERTYLSVLKDQPEVMTVIEVSKVLRLGKNKTYSLINSGKLSSIKVGGKIIVPKMCLVAFLLDTKSYQLPSQIISDNLWISDEKCDMICTADGSTKICANA